MSVQPRTIGQLVSTLDRGDAVATALWDSLGHGVLVGAVPEPGTTDSWQFRTASMKTTVMPPGADGRGMSQEMNAWPLDKPAASRGVAGAILLGRATSNDLVLDHPSVSKLHARILVTADGLKVEDCGSSNGLQVGGKPQPPGIAVDLKTGVVVGLGSVHLTFFTPADLASVIRIRFKRN